MQAGKLDRWVTLQRATSAQSPTSGQPVLTWATLATVRASKGDISDAERVRSAEVAAEIGTRFRIRWSTSWSNLNPKDRVVCEGKTYDIAGVKEIGRREGIEISALARADE